jgi:hypothetical protein
MIGLSIQELLDIGMRERIYALESYGLDRSSFE